MTDASLISILHLSDFHFSKPKWREQEIVVDALTRDLQTLCIGHRRPDLVIFTGDMVQAAAHDSHCEAHDRFIEKVAEATRCSEDRIFILPGNHDVDQQYVEKNIKEHLEWRSAANDVEKMNSLYEQGVFGDHHKKKFAGFLELEPFLGDGTHVYSNEFVTLRTIDPLNVDLLLFNTAMLSLGGLKEQPKDPGYLAVPEYAIRDALSHTREGSFKIFASHHPISDLSEQSGRNFRAAIQRNADLYLFGHLHLPETSEIRGYEGATFFNQAGAIFTRRKGAYIGFSLICGDTSKRLYETHLRTYYSERDAFDEARDVIAEGRFYSSQSARDFWRTIATPVDEAAFRSYLSSECLSKLRQSHKDESNGRDLHEIFVPPPMVKASSPAAAMRIEGNTDKDEVDFEELVRADSNLLLYSPPEYGKTTLLREFQHSFLESAKTIELARLPILIDFADIRYNADSVLRLIKSRSLSPNPEYDIESLIKLGHASILVDDVVFADNKRMRALRDFVKQYPKPRYIFTSLRSSASPYGTHVVLDMPIHFDFIEINQFRRKNMRQLVEKLQTEHDTDIVLDRIQQEISEINLPFTALNGTIFVSIFEQQKGFRPINRSVLIEQFVDVNLKKGDIEESSRGTVDYTIKIAILSHIAKEMAQGDVYILPIEDVRTKIKGFADRKGLIVDLDGLLVEFVASKIFARRPDNRLSFRYRAVLQYFTAAAMIHDSKFKDWVLEDPRYLQFIDEIEYYAGKLRMDDSLLEMIGTRFEGILKTFVDSGAAVDLDRIAGLQLSSSGASASVDALSEQLRQTPLSPEERDRELEGEIPQDAENRQEVFRPNVTAPDQQVILALFLYSGALKNMEIIDDPIKRKHLEKIWRGWAVFLGLALSIVGELAHKRRLRINGILYELNAPAGMTDDELARNMALNLPIRLSGLIYSALGTDKLELQLTEPTLDSANEPLVYEYFRAALIADLRLKHTPSALEAALERFRPSSYLLESMIWKIAELRQFDRFSKGHFEQLNPSVARAIADLKGGTKSVRESESRRQETRLRREAAILKLKRQRDKDEE